MSEKKAPKDFNIVAMNGRLTKDPETKQVGESQVSNFTIANNNYKGEARFFFVSAWGKTSEIISKYFSKGMKIGIEGELDQRSYEKDGSKQSIVSISARSVYFLEAKKENTTNSDKAKDAFGGSDANDQGSFDSQGDDFPF